MATSGEYAEYVCEQLYGLGTVRLRKMFGEYLLYLNGKPLFLLCDQTVFVKILPELAPLMAQAPRGIPYPGAKEHYVLDIDNRPLLEQLVPLLEQGIPLPKNRRKIARGMD